MKSFNEHIAEATRTKGKNYKKGTGDCMIAAANLLMMTAQFGKSMTGTNLEKQDAKEGKIVMVHALVYGQGPIKGQRFCHAWVEDAETVYDHSNGKKIEIPRMVYYAIGNIRSNEGGAYYRYTFDQMRKKMVSSGHYGPWELDETLEENAISDSRQVGRKKVRIPQAILSRLKEGVNEAIITGRPTTNTGVRTGGGVRSLAPAQAQGQHTFVAWNDLKRLESMLDALFAQVGLDIAFTKHFWERINGSRGYGGTVSIPELQDAFRKTFTKYGKQIKDKSVNWKAIILDIGKDHLNMPFVLNWNPQEKEMSIVALTAMKKRNFLASEPKLPV